jgi:hypothetical protein
MSNNTEIKVGDTVSIKEDEYIYSADVVSILDDVLTVQIDASGHTIDINRDKVLSVD